MFKKFFFVTLIVLGFALIPLSFDSNRGFVAYANNQVPAPNLDSGNFMFDLTPIAHPAIEGSVKQNWIRQGINYFFEKTISAMAALIGTLCVLILSVGGFLMLSSAGSEGRYEQGKNYVIYGLIGLAVTLSAYILVTLVQLLIRSIYG